MLAETRAPRCVGGFSVEGGNSLPEPCRKDEKEGKRGERERKKKTSPRTKAGKKWREKKKQLQFSIEILSELSKLSENLQRFLVFRQNEHRVNYGVFLIFPAWWMKFIKWCLSWVLQQITRFSAKVEIIFIYCSQVPSDSKRIFPSLLRNFLSR